MSGGEYKGYNISLTASYWFPVHEGVDIMFGDGINYADDNYMETYFADSLANPPLSG